ncbi:translation initiation factor eIF-5A, putative [Entamoeba histolytica HM-1:IMSS-B]|uniref:Eukaryotic translation initiation factor 5A n=7 Tax=Entamoeba TaxID=5758 RepID=C4LSM2_ENTH1|nr:eukaryotic translation initiation factor 5A-1, putative [Entamoeba dispar SAW760]XP_657397.1 translation initiation factor eIF-5A, putative [Entamoeba histolytica HM-1:IMSS]EMD46625.1 eukaryotic translation initiation factor 5A1, putative [Entamoeba histolytica KU27]EMH75684.1 translation initiation factor eIF-5A, putative [Entamoeba histolytica HM-1:IMSS-B]EMS17266.1 eukaryotic translation initiation factor 5A-1, putative [Entamoeba histolytica HM-3:IMSS]ENY59903.1 eukaryotic translation i|eukprot:EDR25348.1 eukaryotic translation initiation factor 5A-1, putative [Entamoeba dispar SAW760]
MSSSDNEFEKGNAEHSGVYPCQCSALRKGGYVVIKGRPCKVFEMSTSKTGKHGHAKVTYAGYDIFTGKRLDDSCPSTHNVEVPEVKRTEYSLVGINDGYASLLLESGETRDDLKLPEGEMGQKIQADYDDGKELIIAIQTAMGIEAIIDYKEAKD